MTEKPKEHGHEWRPTWAGFDGGREPPYFFVRYLCLGEDCDATFIVAVEGEEIVS